MSKHSIKEVYLNPKMLPMFILGFFSGLPLLLIFSTLSFWLTDKGVDKTTIGLFALVRLPYSFKFVWAPLIDHVKLPILGKMGQRKSWAILFQIGLILTLFFMVRTNPYNSPELTALFAIGVAFFSASQDVVFDAFRIEYFDQESQGAASATFVFGYRMAMLVAGAGALYMSVHLSWVTIYSILALSNIIGIITMLIVKEKKPQETEEKQKFNFIEFLKKSIIYPLKDFTSRKGWIVIILFIMTYKLCETTLGAMTAPFYTEIGFTRDQVAMVAKIYGIAATILGGFLGGALITKCGIMRSLIICGILQGISNLPFAYLATQGNNIVWLSISVISDNMASGMATAAFVAYMSYLCNTAYTATQYALLSSLMALPRDVLSSSAGFIADHTSWPVFFIITAVCCLPGLIILFILNKKYPMKD
ncbi:MAG: AmpG family muropeptide MFS transporter [Alphaproteobacteria bacterium]|nr:AmpG family muropeptide MFS transporter [Alphaproteobacteria bacterium]